MKFWVEKDRCYEDPIDCNLIVSEEIFVKCYFYVVEDIF